MRDADSRRVGVAVLGMVRLEMADKARLVCEDVTIEVLARRVTEAEGCLVVRKAVA